MPPSRRLRFRAPLATLVAVGLVVLAVLPAEPSRRTAVKRDPSPPSTSVASPAVPAGRAAADVAAWHDAAVYADAVQTWNAAVAANVEASGRRDRDPHYGSRPPSVSGPGDGSVSATAYCLEGAMADGAPARYGAVAGNRWPLGTRLRVSPSPVGEIVTVEDRIGSGSELDFAMPGDCGAARAWGRRTVTVEVLDA